MSQHIPLTYQIGDESVLLIDEACSHEALHDNAEARLEAARGMLETIANLEVVTRLHPAEMAHVAQAAQILAADAADLYRSALTSMTNPIHRNRSSADNQNHQAADAERRASHA